MREVVRGYVEVCGECFSVFLSGSLCGRVIVYRVFWEV